MKIIQSRLEGVPGNIVDPDAVQFASRKVAAVSGDARRALDICRRAVEIAETKSLAQVHLPPTPSKKCRSQQEGQSDAKTKSGRVTISTVKQAINEATSSPLQQLLRSMSLAAKLLLAALLARTRRIGIAECILGDVIEESKQLGQMADDPSIRDFLLVRRSFSEKISTTDINIPTLARVSGLGTAAMELMEAGIVGLEKHKGERIGKIRLNVSEDEVKDALKDDAEVSGLGLSV